MADETGKTDDPKTEPPAERAWAPELEALYREYYNRLLVSATRLLRSPHLAEEAVQEAFLRYHTANAKPAAGKEYAYLQSVALNTARSMIRREQRGKELLDEQPRFFPTPEEQLIDKEDDEQLLAALDQLSPRQREVLVLRHCAVLSERKTAEVLSISPGSVKTHASRGRDALRQAFAAQQELAA